MYIRHFRAELEICPLPLDSDLDTSYKFIASEIKFHQSYNNFNRRPIVCKHLKEDGMFRPCIFQICALKK